MQRLILLFLLLTAPMAFAQIPTPVPFSSAPTVSAPAASTAPVAPVPSVNDGANGLLNGYMPDNKYQLRVGDTISFQIKEDRIWNPQDVPKNLVVTDSGEVDVPYIGRVKAVGKTPKELAAEIKTALEKDYYQHATVELSLNTANRVLGSVYIWGQVRNQGRLDIQVNENLTAGQAILRAGGFADFANKKKVKVVRASPNGEKQTFDLDMTDILENGDTEKDIVLKPGDLIIVPSRLINF